MKRDQFLIDGPKRGGVTLILAHGAGAAMDSPFMNVIAEGVAASKIRVARFEFPYMARRRTEGKRPGPDRAPVLLQTWQDAVEAWGGGDRVVVGGKSMGGRIASMIADEAGVRGVVCLGYPFHPPGKPDKLRTAHLEKLKTPTLILQGSRDPFGTRDEVPGYGLSRKIKLHWLEDGDHSLKPRKKSGFTLEQHLEDAVTRIVKFVEKVGG